MKRSPEKFAEARRLRKEGWTYEAIGGVFDVNPSTIQYWLKPKFRAKAKAYQKMVRDEMRKLEERRNGCGLSQEVEKSVT
jgi:hypothetical protein